MRAILSALGVVAVAATGYAGFVTPVASGYIYRSDNNGPASLIQLGAVPYQQPHAFAPPLPLAQPLQLQALEAYDLVRSAPAPLPYIAPKPIGVLDAADENENDDDSEEYLEIEKDVPNDGHRHAEKRAGSEYDEEHHEVHGEKGSQGYNSENHHADGESGSYEKDHLDGFYQEGKGVQKNHLDESDAQGKHYQAEKNYNGGDHEHKKHFNKGEDVTGYHKVFHKDEFQKDHDFYDVSDKSVHFKKYDHGHKDHGSKDGAHKDGAHHDTGFDKKRSGKAGFHVERKADESEEGHLTEEGNESQYRHEEDYGRKGGKEQEKEYAFNDDDDEKED